MYRYRNDRGFVYAVQTTARATAAFQRSQLYRLVTWRPGIRLIYENEDQQAFINEIQDS